MLGAPPATAKFSRAGRLEGQMHPPRLHFVPRYFVFLAFRMVLASVAGATVSVPDFLREILVLLAAQAPQCRACRVDRRLK